MITQQSQIKLNLPIALKEFLESKAKRYGLPISGYVRHLIIKDVSDMDYPVYEASERTIRRAKKALKEKSKSIVAKDIDKFFKNL